MSGRSSFLSSRGALAALAGLFIVIAIARRLDLHSHWNYSESFPASEFPQAHTARSHSQQASANHPIKPSQEFRWKSAQTFRRNVTTAAEFDQLPNFKFANETWFDEATAEPLERFYSDDMNCVMFKNACVDYNNVLVVFSTSYELTGIVPAYVTDDLFGGILHHRLRLSIGGGDQIWYGGSENAFNNLHIKVRLATPNEERDHLRGFHKRVFNADKSAQPSIPGPDQDRVGVVLAYDWPDNYCHTQYAGAKLIKAYDNGLFAKLGIDRDVSPGDNLQQCKSLPDIIPLIADGGKLPSFVRTVFGILPHQNIFSTDSAIKVGKGCYEKMVVCRVDSMLPPKYPNSKLYQLGQSIKMIGLNLTVDEMLGVHNEQRRIETEISQSHSAVVSSSQKEMARPAPKSSTSSTTVTVTFVERLDGSRSLVNLPELLKFCNEHYRSPLAHIKMRCRPHAFGENSVTDLRIADTTDVLVGLHGSGLNNMLYLKPGSHVVEVRSVDSPKWFSVHYEKTASTIGYDVRFWATVVSKQDTIPGYYEKTNIGDSAVYGRDCSLRLPPLLLNLTFNRLSQTWSTRGASLKHRYMALLDANMTIISYNESTLSQSQSLEHLSNLERISKEITANRNKTRGDIKHVYRIPTTEGFGYQLLQLENICTAVVNQESQLPNNRSKSVNVLLTNFESAHYKDVSSVRLCDYFRKMKCIGDFSVDVKFACTAASAKDVILKRGKIRGCHLQEFLLNHEHTFNETLWGELRPIYRENSDLFQTWDGSVNPLHPNVSCIMGFFSPVNEFDADAKPKIHFEIGHTFKLQAQHIANYMLTYESSDKKFSHNSAVTRRSLPYGVIHWRRGDQLRTRCGAHLHNAGLNDKSVNCQDVEAFLRVVSEVRRHSSGTLPLYVSTNEADPAILRVLNSAQLHTYSSVMAALASSSDVVSSSSTSAGKAVVEWEVMAHAEKLWGAGQSAIHQIIAKMRTARGISPSWLSLPGVNNTITDL